MTSGRHVTAARGFFEGTFLLTKILLITIAVFFVYLMAGIVLGLFWPDHLRVLGLTLWSSLLLYTCWLALRSLRRLQDPKVRFPALIMGVAIGCVLSLIFQTLIIITTILH